MLTEGAREALEGDRLISQEGEVPLTFAPHAPKSDVNGQIIAVTDDATQIGQYQVVVLNRGARTASRRARCWPSTSGARWCRTSTATCPLQQGSLRPSRCSCRTSAPAR